MSAAPSATIAVDPFSAQATLRRFAILVQTDLRAYSRIKAVTFWILLFPIGLMLVFGSTYGSEAAGANLPAGLRVIHFITANMIVLSMMSNGIITNAVALASFRERGFLNRIRTTPLPLWQFLLARIVAQTVIMLLQATVIVLTSMLVFGTRFAPAALLGTVPVVIFGSLVFMAIGCALPAVIKKTDTVTVASQTLNMTMLFLGGLTVPLHMLPRAVAAVGTFLPSAMIAKVMLATSVQLPVEHLALNVVGLLAYAAVAIALAARLFGR